VGLGGLTVFTFYAVWMYTFSLSVELLLKTVNPQSSHYSINPFIYHCFNHAVASTAAVLALVYHSTGESVMYTCSTTSSEIIEL
jgi:hypothetical protein